MNLGGNAEVSGFRPIYEDESLFAVKTQRKAARPHMETNITELSTIKRRNNRNGNL